MKHLNTILLTWLSLLVTSEGFAVIHPSSRTNTALNSVGIFFSTSTGNTETVAEYIADATGGYLSEISECDPSELLGHDSIILGCPTWNHGMDDHQSGTAMDDFLYETLPSLDLTGKKVAVFGCGDSSAYCDSYCDAAGEVYDNLVAKGCKMYGFTSTEGYNYINSKAIKDGKFCGYVLLFFQHCQTHTLCD